MLTKLCPLFALKHNADPQKQLFSLKPSPQIYSYKNNPVKPESPFKLEFLSSRAVGVRFTEVKIYMLSHIYLYHMFSNNVFIHLLAI